MNRHMRTQTLWALLIVAALASAYVIVTRNGSAVSGPAGQAPVGVFH